MLSDMNLWDAFHTMESAVNGPHFQLRSGVDLKHFAQYLAGIEGFTKVDFG